VGVGGIVEGVVGGVCEVYGIGEHLTLGEEWLVGYCLCRLCLGMGSLCVGFIGCGAVLPVF